MAKATPTRRYTYGFRSASILAALANGVILLVATVFVAILSEFLVGAIGDTAKRLGMSGTFVGARLACSLVTGSKRSSARFPG